MKCMVILSLVGLINVHANILEQHVSLSLQNATVKQALKEIEKQCDLVFMYDYTKIDVNKAISIHANNETVESVLNRITQETGSWYEIIDKQIVLLPKPKAFEEGSVSQNITISGTVTDDKGEPIPGVNVVVKGTTTGAFTAANGVFSINVPNNDAVLVFSFIGYTTQEIAVAGRRALNVMMSEDTKQIDEVVVVGYGVQRKSSLTGSMAAINSQKLTTVTTPRVENMLNGKVPGVYVDNGSGQPGSNSSIVIRGRTTINGSTSPLWVIDGVIVGNSSGELNPADIESVTVLKDAASTAIYGSQGSNGVVIVTTKKGKAGTPTVMFSAKTGINKLNNGNLQMMNGPELYEYYESFQNPERFVNATWWTPDLKNRNFDWWDCATQTGVSQDYNISASGGTDRLSAFASLGYYDETGTVKGYDWSRYSARVSLNYKMFDWLTIKPHFSISRRDIDNRQHSLYAIYINLPWDSPYRKDDGKIIDRGSNGDPLWINAAGENYLYDLQWNYSQSCSYEMMGNFDFNIRLTDWLNFESVNSYRFSTGTSMSYTDPRSRAGQSTSGNVYNSYSGSNRLYLNQMFRFNKTFNDVHNINGILAYEWNEYNGDNFDATGASIPPGAEILDLAAIPNTISGSKSQWAVQSYFSKVGYSYQNRYFVDGSLRRDGASNFGRENQYGTFFSIGGAWSIHEEAFFENLKDIVNNAKLRLTYGKTGNRPSSNYPQYTLYSLSSDFSYNGKPSALISSVGNDEMTWETTYTTNGGVDVSFFKSRLNISLDLYNKNTSGLLYQTPLPTVWGVNSVWRNVGEVSNKGLEVTIGGDIIRNPEMLWNIEFNWGMNRNKVVSLYGERQEIIVTSGTTGVAETILKPGYDIATWYTAEWAGVNPETGGPQWYETDANGNRVITTNQSDALRSSVMLGTYTPKFFGGFNTAFNYKGIDLTAIFSYSVGGKIYHHARSTQDSDGMYTDRNQSKLYKGWTRWEKPGDIATHPKPEYNHNTMSNYTSSRYLENGSYLKMRNITLGYSLPVKWIQSMHLSNVRLYVTGENLLTITEYSGVDPEMGLNGFTSTSGYPKTKSCLFGINVTF